MKANNALNRGDSKTASRIRFSSTLMSPRLPAVSGRPTAKAVSWTFLILPKEPSAKLPSRGRTTVEGTLNGRAYRATLGRQTITSLPC